MNKLYRSKIIEEIIIRERNINGIQDIDVLLEKLLSEVRKYVNADAGSIYIVEGSKLKIKCAQNDTQLKKLPAGKKLKYVSFSFPIDETSIAGYVALTGNTLVIDDVYKLDSNTPYKFNKKPDIENNYRTKSMYSIPLKISNGKVVGVMQLINAKSHGGKVVKFSKDAEIFINHFALHTEQALRYAFLLDDHFKKMLRLSEFRDPKETYLHVERVSLFSLEIYDAYAFKHNIPQKEQEIFKDNLRIAAKFHDIGKVGISDLILKKPGRFTDCERDIMKGHTCLGAMLFYPIKSDLDQMSFDVALYHHERFDGGAAGYPGKSSFHEFYNKFENGTDDKMSAGMSYGQFFESNCINPSVNSFNVEIGVPLVVKQPLKGDEIPLSARIVAIADVFDALSHKRVYKNAWSLEDAFNEIKNNSGLQFDPELVDAFMSSKEQILAIFNAHGE